MRALVLAALLLAGPAFGQTPQRVGPLQVQNALSEIAAAGSTAQAAARANIGVSAAFTAGCGQLITGATLSINYGTVACSALQGSMLGTSGATIPLLNGANTWSAGQTFANPIGLTGSGPSGQYDAQISVAGGGSVVGQGALNYTAGTHSFLAYDSTIQFQIGYQLGSAEYWNAMGGLPAGGGTLYATNGTLTGNVDGNFAAQNQGQFWFGNGAGMMFAILNPGGIVGAYLTVKPANAQAATGGGTASLISTGDLALVPSGSGNRVTVSVPDGTAAGGNNRGTGAVDLQFARTAATQVCSGANSYCVGSNNTGSGANAFVGGNSNICDGTWCSMAGGQNGAVNGRYGVRAYSSGVFVAGGDAEITDSVFRGTSVSGAAVRLTANSTAASSTNCYNLPAGKAASLNMTLVGLDQNTLTKSTAWFNKGLLVRSTTAATTTFAMGTATTLGSDTVTVAAVTDTTNGCLSFTTTPDNSDTWHFVLTVNAAEVQ